MRGPVRRSGLRRDALSVSWKQVAAFRLRRHHLAERAPPTAMPTVVADMGGAQAQLLAAAELSLWARIRDLSPGALESALWKHRKLAKAWCMRRTLHLLPSKELPIFVRGTARRAEKEIRWVLNRGVPASVLNRLVEATLSALDEPRSRTEIAERVGRALGLTLSQKPGGGWGSRRLVPCVQLGKLYFPAYYLLHLAGARGVICSGPNRGSEATFVRGDAWVRGFHDIPPERAEEELLRRYLRAFGPGTIADFVAWTRIRFSDAQGIWARVEDELSPVDVDGASAWILRRDRSELLDAHLDGPSVRLLPYFDSYLLGHMERTHLLEAKHHRRVYRDQGWVAPVLLVDGRVAGVWSHDRKGARLSVHIRSFGGVSRDERRRIGEEVTDLGRYLGATHARTEFGSARPAARA